MRTNIIYGALADDRGNDFTDFYSYLSQIS